MTLPWVCFHQVFTAYADIRVVSILLCVLVHAVVL